MDNPFVETVSQRKVVEGCKLLVGGATLRVTHVGINLIHLELRSNPFTTQGGEVVLSLPSLQELSSTLTEICVVMKENKR